MGSGKQDDLSDLHGSLSKSTHPSKNGQASLFEEHHNTGEFLFL